MLNFPVVLRFEANQMNIFENDMTNGCCNRLNIYSLDMGGGRVCMCGGGEGRRFQFLFRRR